MAIITIQCRLTASEETRRYFWGLMIEKNTPLVNELLQQVSQHAEFKTWQQSGKLPKKIVRQICAPLEQEEQFTGQPDRFYASAICMVADTYEAWFALQGQRHRRLDGMKRWLSMIQSDVDLAIKSATDVDTLRNRAKELLTQFYAGTTAPNPQSSKKPSRKAKTQAQGKNRQKTNSCLSYSIPINRQRMS